MLPAAFADLFTLATFVTFVLVSLSVSGTWASPSLSPFFARLPFTFTSTVLSSGMSPLGLSSSSAPLARSNGLLEGACGADAFLPLRFFGSTWHVFSSLAFCKPWSLWCTSSSVMPSVENPHAAADGRLDGLFWASVGKPVLLLRFLGSPFTTSGSVLLGVGVMLCFFFLPRCFLGHWVSGWIKAPPFIHSGRPRSLFNTWASSCNRLVLIYWSYTLRKYSIFGHMQHKSMLTHVLIGSELGVFTSILVLL